MHCSRNREKGLSLVELLMTVAITLSVAAAAFHLFHNGERVFRDQALIVEMEQVARLLASQVNDDIRVAGQGLPPGLSDVVLPGSGPSRVNIRAGFTATESLVTSAFPLPVEIAVPLTVGIESTVGFSSNRQAFLWTETDWARVTIDSVSGVSRTIRITPSVLSRSPLSFTQPPSISTDEAVAIYRDATLQVVRRTTATNTNASNGPTWAPANELATNVTELAFLYYDASGKPLTVDDAEERQAVRMVETRITVRASGKLSNGSRPTYSLSIKTVPRNLALH
jgi:Tfp pilus assembly protein PilW